MSPINRCRSCGATSYKSIICRDEKGGMRASGQYKCVGCSLAFKVIDEWRVDGMRVTGQQMPRDTYAAVRSLHDQ